MKDLEGTFNLKGTEERQKTRPVLWMALGLLVFVIIFGCAQFAVLAGIPQSSVSIRSEIQADYGVWDLLLFAGLRPGIIAEAARDAGNGDFGSTVAEGCFLPDDVCENEAITPIGTVQSSPVITETIEPNPTEIQSTEIIVVAWIPPSDEGDEDDDEGSSPPPAVTPSPTIGTPAPTTVTPDPTTVTPAPTTVTPDPTTVTPSPTTATPDPTTPAPTFTIIPVQSNLLEIGAPDGDHMSIPAGDGVLIDLSANPIVVDATPDPDIDLVVYEQENGNSNQVLLDFMIVQISQSAGGDWFVVFDWGDQAPDTNTNVASLASGGEQNNEAISMDTPGSPLYGTPDLNTGISIDVDAKVSTPGVYPWIMIGAPVNGGDPAEIDAVEVLPTPTS